MDDNEIRCDDPSPLSMGYRIPIANQQNALAIDEDRLQAAVLSVLEDSTYSSAMVSIAVVDDPTIHKINREYLQHDYPTDVLSFTLSDADSHLEGELVVSTETAIRYANQYGWAATEELLLYVIHGALHLVGYRDKDTADQTKMVAAEATQLQKLGITLPAAQSRWQSPKCGEVSAP